MFGLSIGKLLVIVAVILAVWRGLRLLQTLGQAIGDGGDHRRQPQRRAATSPPATEHVECPRCGVFVPNGTICPSTEQCRYQRQA